MKGLIDRLFSMWVQAGARLSRLARRSWFLGLLLDAWQAYGRDEMATLAAALSYYLLLAIFPLLLFLIVAASPFISSEQVIREVGRFVGSYLPTVSGEIRSILHEVVTARGPVTIIAALGLMWSASGVFDVAQRGLNRAWGVSQPRPLWRQRLVSVAAVIGIGALFGLSFASSALARGGIYFRVDLGSTSVEVVSLLIATILSFFLFALIYKVFPFAQVAWRQVWGGALLAAVLWETAKYLFVWYLLNFARLSLIYGSVGAIIALLVWGYITATILLFGAELTALDARKKMKMPSQ
jgi:membrane protein